ncbi:hypothetical protein KKHLCK_10220 [Candidatus Electrothrix laxa]
MKDNLLILKDMKEMKEENSFYRGNALYIHLVSGLKRG